jgi:hypothetical protein
MSVAREAFAVLDTGCSMQWKSARPTGCDGWQSRWIRPAGRSLRRPLNTTVWTPAAATGLGGLLTRLLSWLLTGLLSWLLTRLLSRLLTGLLAGSAATTASTAASARRHY